ncbi:MAG TPA: hypothetical protein VMV49_15200 [Candidatus Deferrimicrobium sp.]|nr:hypothetical protein [Candidatus Deferrimicrobium sp.]
MESIDSLIGPASISELKKTIAICTQTHQTDLQIVPMGYYTDGTTIFISAPPKDLDLVERWILLEAGTIHESWHILFQSDFYLLKEFIKRYEEEYRKTIPFIGKIAHDIVNIIEDARIEFLGKKRFVGNKNTIQFSNVYWLRKRPSFKGLQDWEIFIEGLLQLAVCEGLKELISDSRVEILVKIANFYLQWAKAEENSRASFLTAEKIMELLLENFEMEGNYSQQVQGPPSTIDFKPQSNSEQLTSQDIPELPKELKDELKQLQKEKDLKEKQSKSMRKQEEEQKNSKEASENGVEPGNIQENMDKQSFENNDEIEGQQQSSAGNNLDEQKNSEMNQDVDDQEISDIGESTGDKQHSGKEDIRNDQQKSSMGEDDAEQQEIDEDENINAKNQSESGEMIDEKQQSAKSESVKEQEQLGKDQNTECEEEGDNKNDRKGQSQSSKGQTQNKNENISERESQELTIVDLDEIDPLKSGHINPAALKIKIDDLVKRNYNLLKDRELEQKAKEIVKKIEASKRYKRVFYTKTFDIGVESEQEQVGHSEAIFLNIYKSLRSLIQVTINQFKALFKSGSETTSQLKFGRLDSRKMVKGLVNEDPHIFKKKILNEGTNEIAIVLLIDQSGSMYGEKIVNAQKAAILFGEVLNALNLNFAIYGWTDIDYHDSHLYPYLVTRMGRLPSWQVIEFPAEINTEIFTIYCYKEFNENYDGTKKKLGLITALCDNSDHNAIEFIAEKLLQTKKKVKILMILSDGQPNAKCYDYIRFRLTNSYNRSYNVGNLGINLTRQSIENAQKLGIQTLCISIDSSKNYQEQIYGENNYIIVDPKNIQELPVKVAKVLSLVLRRAGIKV